MLPLSSSEPSSGKTFFPSERRESNSYYYRNHATHRIRDWIPGNEFLAVFASYPLQQPQQHTNPCLFCVFVPLSPFFLTELTEFFHKTQWKTWHSLRSIANVSLWWWNVIPLRTVCSIHSMKWSLKSKCPHLWAMSLICLKIYRFFSLLQ